MHRSLGMSPGAGEPLGAGPSPWGDGPQEDREGGTESTGVRRGPGREGEAAAKAGSGWRIASRAGSGERFRRAFHA